LSESVVGDVPSQVHPMLCGLIQILI